MLCLRCNNEAFSEKIVATPQRFRGDEFTVKAPAMVCNKCNWATVTDAQADELAKIATDEYRRRHGGGSKGILQLCTIKMAEQ